MILAGTAALRVRQQFENHNDIFLAESTKRWPNN